MIDPPAVSAVLTELWGEYCCNGVGGDFSLPGAVDKQRLHSDIADAFKYPLPKHSLNLSPFRSTYIAQTCLAEQVRGD